MKPLIRLFLLVVCATFGVIVGTLTSVALTFGISEDGFGLVAIDFDYPEQSFDTIVFGSEGDRTRLENIPDEMSTHEAVSDFYDMKFGDGRMDEQDLQRVIDLSIQQSQRRYSHSEYPATFWILAIGGFLVGLAIALFSGRWLWRFLYAEGD